MPVNPLRPYRDESLHRAAERIRHILEQEEAAKRRRSSFQLSNRPSRSHPAQYDESGSRSPSLDRAHAGLTHWERRYDPLQPIVAFGGEEADRQLAQASPMPSPMPIPVPLPPIVIPGSKENQEWVERARRLLRDWGRSVPGGGPDCDQEWNDARRMCNDELAKPNPNRSITGGYANPEDCARGLVSERCRGNKVQWPRHWKFGPRYK